MRCNRSSRLEPRSATAAAGTGCRRRSASGEGGICLGIAGGPSDANWHVFLPAHIEAVTLNPGSQILAILSAPLFEDSFESGDTSAWSATNP